MLPNASTLLEKLRDASQTTGSLLRQVAETGNVLVRVTRGDLDLAVMASAIRALAWAVGMAREARVEESLVSQAQTR
jgi:hypothetical protein